MKKLLLLCTLVLTGTWLLAAPAPRSVAPAYTPLDAANPIAFDGTSITYNGEQIVLGPHAIFLDGRLSDAQTGPYTFNTIQKALAALTDGTESEPMKLYMAPWVYWVDDPDDPAIRKPDPAVPGPPFGAVIDCEWLHFVGLSPDPRNVVMACNRGQTHGSEGNFTMFNILGDGLMADNVTFGNYCNIDLEFPLDPRLNRARRAGAIVQAQLVFSNADKAFARNCRFMSRLNLNPIRGARRLLFVDCHFETTDDALAATGVYLHCDFDVYGWKPFGSTSEDGAVLMDCDIRSYQTGSQFVTKRDNAVIMVDTRIHNAVDPNLYMGWSGNPQPQILCYQFGNSLNGKALDIKQLDKTVDMTGTTHLNAFRVEHEGRVIYNTYNLLRGDDDWDPMGVKEQVVAAGKAAGKDYTMMPVYLRVTPRTAEMLTGGDPIRFEAKAYRHGLYEVATPALTWTAAEAVTFVPQGGDVTVTAANQAEASSKVQLIARTADGLAGASSLAVSPAILPAPAFVKAPAISKIVGGKATLEYTLDLGARADQSIITWYRCSDKAGADPIVVAVSRLDEPVKSYTLTPGDVGHYLMAKIEPKHLRSEPGTAVTAISKKPIVAKEILGGNEFATDFRHFPGINQPAIIPGAWTLGGFKPVDTDYYGWKATTERDNWDYRPGVDNSAGVWGLVQLAQGARMLYTPVEGSYGDMSIAFDVAPSKEGGQGFGSATGQYMDFMLKYDTRTLSGYGLRIERTPKYGDAVDATLMRYQNGVATPLGQTISTNAYRTLCTIRVAVAGDKITASVTTSDPKQPTTQGVSIDAQLEATIVPNTFGGVGVQHTGTVGANSTWIKNMTINWK